MAQIDTTQQHQTLGQRIDALLSPLYAQADQYRATLDLAKAQIQQLQQQIIAATDGLSRIESQMAQVVRRLAEQDPVLSVLVSPTAVAAMMQSASPTQTPTPTLAPPAWQTPPQAATTPHTLPANATASSALQRKSADEPAEFLSDTQAFAGPSTTLPATPGPDVVPLDLDPQTDQAMVDEAAQLLASPPSSTAATAGELSATLPPDIAAAAERAAIAARQLREQAFATR